MKNELKRNEQKNKTLNEWKRGMNETDNIYKFSHLQQLTNRGRVSHVQYSQN